jgi:excisionase family DNA binding protein
MEKLLLKPEEAAGMLGLGRAKVYAMVAAGELPSVKLGRRCVRIPIEHLRTWLQERLKQVDCNQQ